MLKNNIFYNYHNNNINSLTLLKRALLYNIRSLSHRDVEFIYKSLISFYYYFFLCNFFYFIREYLL